MVLALSFGDADARKHDKLRRPYRLEAALSIVSGFRTAHILSDIYRQDPHRSRVHKIDKQMPPARKITIRYKQELPLLHPSLSVIPKGKALPCPYGDNRMFISLSKRGLPC